MNKMLLGLLFACMSFSAMAQSTFSDSHLPLPVPVANGGTGQVGGLVFNSTAAASANTMAIQTALTAGGLISINCPAGSTLWVSGPLVSYSFSHITGNCYLENVANNNLNMFYNQAAVSSWTTEYINSGTIATGPLAMIWQGNTPNWVASTSYVKGNYVVANGNIYWENAASCTSAGSGGPSGNSGTSTGPTGTTGAAIADNTCSWYYVTVNNANSNSYSPTSYTIYYPGNTLAVNNFITVTPQPDTGSSNAWTASQTAHTRGGPCDSAYFGTFLVTAINDSNYVTVQLERMPTASFSGIPINVKQADQNIIVDGNLTFDGNNANNTSYSGIESSSNLVFANVADLEVTNVGTNQSPGYGLILSGGKNVNIGFLRSPGGTGNSSNQRDLLKIYGSFDVVAHDLYPNSDLGGEISVQTEESPTGSYTSYILANQDTLNVTVRNLSGKTCCATTYPSHPSLYMDQIIWDTVDIKSTNYGNYFINVQGPITGTANVGSIVYRNVTASGGQGNAGQGASIDNLVLDNVSNGPSSTTASYGLPVFYGYANINHLLLSNSHISTGSNQKILSLYGTVKDVTVSGGTVVGTNGTLISDDGLAVTSATVRDVYVSGIGALFSGGNDTANVYFQNVQSSSTSTGAAFSGGTHTVNVSGSSFYNMAQGIARFNNTATISMLSSGGNSLTGTSVWWTFPVGTDTASSYGFDIQCDVTKMTRTTGEYCYNTNTSPGSGTLTTAGPVMDQGTSSGSWFALYSPLLQTY